MKKILLLLTGGTIGSFVNEDSITLNPHSDFFSFYPKEKAVDFEIQRPYTLLSENAKPEHWLMMIQTLRDLDLNHYAGIIIAHGSDTLPYLGSALCYGLDTPKIPIVLIAANFPPDHPKSNAQVNFSSAVDFIKNQELPGIYAIYQNQDGKVYVHLASRLLEADWVYDDFKSFGNLPLGVLDHRGLCCIPSSKNPTMMHLYNPELNLVPWVDSFKNKILGLKLYPGFNYDRIDLKNHPVKAIFHSIYHCGTANVLGEQESSLLCFIKNHPEVDHYLSSFKNDQRELYDSSHQLICAGGIPLSTISFEAAITKLYFAYNQLEYTPQNYMLREFFYEFLRETPENGYVL